MSTSAALLAAALLTPAPSAPQESVPPLVVMIAVDQLIPEQLERLGGAMTGGFARLLKDGVSFDNAALPYARTETGAGHVTFSTGCLPRSHGVVGNTFFDRTTGKSSYCVEDNTAELVTDGGIVSNEGRRSPRTILRPTFAELLQLELGDARVVSISAKDRAAVGMAGYATGQVLWWDKKRGGGFVSSTPYMEEILPYVKNRNRLIRAAARDWVWEDTSPAGEEGERFEAWGTAADERDGERPVGQRVSFPYPIPEGLAEENLGGFLYGTPAVDGFVIDLAIDSLDNQALGLDGITDVLALSFSGCDVVGHQNGPYSREVTDLLFRLDRGLERLFQELDLHVGEGSWLCVLTADHGVLPLPERQAALGLPGRRVSGEERKAMRAALTDLVEARLGTRLRLRSAPGGFHLDPKVLGKSGVEPAAARAAVATALRDLRIDHPWIEDAYSIDEIARFGPDQLGTRALLRNSFHPDRTADVVLLQSPGVLVGMAKGTSHGTHHAYDRRVPLLFYGPGTEGLRGAAARGVAVGSHDAVPTMLALMGMAPADIEFDGRSLLAR